MTVLRPASEAKLHRATQRKNGLLRRGVYHRAGRRPDPLAPRNDGKHAFAPSPRHAPEPLLNLSPKEGVGNAGCPLHPRPRVHLVVVERTRVYEYTGITRHSRTQWF